MTSQKIPIIDLTKEEMDTDAHAIRALHRLSDRLFSAGDTYGTGLAEALAAHLQGFSIAGHQSLTAGETLQ